MKNLKDILTINENRDIALEIGKVKYSMVSVKVNDSVDGFVFKSIEEIKKWYLQYIPNDKKYVDDILSLIKPLKMNETIVINHDHLNTEDYEIISRVI